MTKEKDNQFLAEYSTTYSTLPEFIDLDTKGKVLFIKKDKIIKWFEIHKGRHNATKLNEIASRLGFDSYGNAVNFRAIVSSLVVDDGYPIVSCIDGYYKAITREDFNQMIRTEEKRIQGVAKRIKALVKMRDDMLFEKKKEEVPIPFELLNL